MGTRLAVDIDHDPKTRFRNAIAPACCPSVPGFSAEPALPAFCRLQRKFGRYLPAGIFRWFYVFAGWRSFCLSKTDPKRRNALVSILVVGEPSDKRSSSRLKVRFSTRARRVHGASVSDRRSRKLRPCVSDHVQVTQNAPRHFRSTQCCMRSRSTTLAKKTATYIMHKIRTLFLSWDIEKSSLIALRCAAMREVAASRATVPISCQSWSCWYHGYRMIRTVFWFYA